MMIAGQRSASLTWVHIGDLHITTEREPNYRDFKSLVGAINANLARHIDFCVFPGDNADDGTAEQYDLIRQCLESLEVPMYVIPGDHDRKPGDLNAFYQTLGLPPLPRALSIKGHRCLFLDVVSEGSGGPDFALGTAQLAWLEAELQSAEARRQPSVIFMHAYPADLKRDGTALTRLLHQHHVAFVDMGHTHYNELANDGCTIFATTRSTGQVEEGCVGFSLVSLSGGVVSWRFKPLHSPWPFVMITSPADHRLLTDLRHPAHIVSGQFKVQAQVFGSNPRLACRCRINDGDWLPLHFKVEHFEAVCEAPTQQFTLTVEARDPLGNTDTDSIVVAVPGFRSPHRTADGGDADAIGEWPERHLLGTRLGPNRNGRQW